MHRAKIAASSRDADSGRFVTNVAGREPLPCDHLGPGCPRPQASTEATSRLPDSGARPEPHPAGGLSPWTTVSASGPLRKPGTQVRDTAGLYHPSAVLRSLESLQLPFLVPPRAPAAGMDEGRRPTRVRPSEAVFACHRSISGRSQSIGRPGPRFTTGLQRRRRLESVRCRRDEGPPGRIDPRSTASLEAER
jgi:hypothetical protein